ncbi:hypothetical protein [Fulvitalea axinellae]
MKFTHSEFLQVCDSVYGALNRDIAVFSDYGIQATFSESYKTKIDTLREIMPDEYWEGQQMLKTSAKDILRRSIERQIGDLRFRMKLAFGDNSPEYRHFKFGKFTSFTDAELISHAKRVASAARGMLDKLANRGVTEEELTALDIDRKGMDQSIDDLTEAKRTRQAMTMERSMLLGELYRMVTEVCEIGKHVWKEDNEAKYKEYVLYGSRSKKVEELTEDKQDEDSKE